MLGSDPAGQWEPTETPTRETTTPNAPPVGHAVDACVRDARSDPPVPGADEGLSSSGAPERAGKSSRWLGCAPSGRRVGQRAVIDLDLAAAGYSSTTSAQGLLIGEQLSAIAFQFDGLTELEPRFDGSCEAFGDALQVGECIVMRRDATRP